MSYNGRDITLKFLQGILNPERANLTTSSHRQNVYTRIKADILTGVYGLREQLAVDELTRKYAVSATPVREALSLLECDGLVEIVPRVGYFTARITVEEIHNLFELRAILESNAVRLAALRATEEELAALKQLHGEYTVGDTTTYLPWLKFNRQFHRGVAVASHNRDLANLVGSVVDRLQRVHLSSLDLMPFPPADVQSHERIIAALYARDPIDAQAAVLDHVGASRDAALRRIVERPSGWGL